jgi:hypothetical protein
MDVSVLAAIGSFVVSERVLKPKATLLVILGCVLAYDLTTKTRDPSSLRVYRGNVVIRRFHCKTFATRKTNAILFRLHLFRLIRPGSSCLHIDDGGPVPSNMAEERRRM